MCKEPDNNGWLDRRAAEGMLLLVEEALEKPVEETPPFKAFLDMMEHIGLERGTLLDVGCGVGGYSALVDRFYPGIEYRGCDISPHMIEIARRKFDHIKLGYVSRFVVRDALKLQRGADIILASSLIETCPNWRHVLRHLCSLDFQYLILNRVRIWNDEGRPALERIYQTIYKTGSFEVIHNWGELAQLTWDAGVANTHTIAYQVEPETQLVCLLFEKEEK
jgi:SAM-dependent methyltransferase